MRAFYSLRAVAVSLCSADTALKKLITVAVIKIIRGGPIRAQSKVRNSDSRDDWAIFFFLFL